MPKGSLSFLQQHFHWLAIRFPTGPKNLQNCFHRKDRKTVPVTYRNTSQVLQEQTQDRQGHSSARQSNGDHGGYVQQAIESGPVSKQTSENSVELISPRIHTVHVRLHGKSEDLPGLGPIRLARDKTQRHSRAPLC